MRLLPFVALCSTIFISCDQAATGPDVDENAATTTWPATKTTEGGAFSVTLEPGKGDILWNEHFSLNLSIKPRKADGGPLTVIVDADMPAHRHGMNTKPELAPTGEHEFQVDGMLFHMKGAWVITVDVTGGGVTERATFPVFIK